jgi:hypothetical protein
VVTPPRKTRVYSVRCDPPQPRGVPRASRSPGTHSLRLLKFSCGTKDHLINNSDRFHAFLGSHHITHSFERTECEPKWPGRLDDHTWAIWRMDLRDVAPLLFR